MKGLISSMGAYCLFRNTNTPLTFSQHTPLLTFTCPLSFDRWLSVFPPLIFHVVYGIQFVTGCVSIRIFGIHTTHIPADTRRWINVVLTLVHRRRRWSSVKTTLIQRLVSAGVCVSRYGRFWHWERQVVGCRAHTNMEVEFSQGWRHTSVWYPIHNLSNYTQQTRRPSKHETFTKCWYNVRPASQTMDQHGTNIGWTSRVFWFTLIVVS